MPYAMIVVFDSDHEHNPALAAELFSELAGRAIPQLSYVSNAWEVEDRSEQADYFTQGLLDQRPEPDPPGPLPLLERLRASGIARVKATYAGSGDEGWVEEVELFDSAGHKVGEGSERFYQQDEHPLAQEVADWVDAAIDQAGYAGYENNEGGGGTVSLNVDTGHAVVSHGYYPETELVMVPPVELAFEEVPQSQPTTT